MTNKLDKEEENNSLKLKADEAALELMKQLIALASGVLALSATFVGRLQDTSVYHLSLLALSWLSLVISIFFGLQTLSAIVQSRLTPDESDWSTGYGQMSAKISKYGFVIGIALFAVFAFLSLLHPGGATQNN